MLLLILNSGSSSIKFRLYDMERELAIVSGKVERIGEANSDSVYYMYAASGDVKEHQEHSPVADHAAGLKQVFTFLESSGSVTAMQSLHAIGHRVVHGGELFQSPVLINNEVIEGIRAMIPLAPLHNPANLAGIEAAHKLYPHVPQVAVFDTAFFQTLPPHAHRYAVPDELYRDHQVRRYGFHGTSHQYVAREAADFLQQRLDTLRLITLHLGNGASMAAIRDGICIDTSMGMTPLEGLIMGTRCGDIDPALHFYLARTPGMELDEIETMLNHNSGMKGLCGTQDMREIHRLAEQGDELARLAIEMYCYRIVKYIGAYYTILGGLDALIFTAGIGENDALIRQMICDRLVVLGLAINQPQSAPDDTNIMDISAKETQVKVLVIQTNEELEIARQTVSVINNSS